MSKEERSGYGAKPRVWFSPVWRQWIVTQNGYVMCGSRDWNTAFLMAMSLAAGRPI